MTLSSAPRAELNSPTGTAGTSACCGRFCGEGSVMPLAGCRSRGTNMGCHIVVESTWD